MSFQTMLAADAAAFTNPAEFGAAVTYTPHGGDAKTINMLLVGSPPFKTGQTERALAQVIDAYVSRADVPTVTRDGDRFTTADGTAYVVAKVFDEQDPAMWHLQAKRV